MNRQIRSWWSLPLLLVVLAVTGWAVMRRTQAAAPAAAPAPTQAPSQERVQEAQPPQGNPPPTARREELSKTLLNLAASHEARLQAATELGKLKNDPSSLDPLLEVLDTRDLELREAALESLRELGAVKVLQGILADSKQPESARKAAARGLRFLKDASSTQFLVAGLKNPSASVRAESALALSTLDPAAAQDELIAALKDPDKDVRYYAADALGSVPTSKVKAALEASKAVETDETVQYALDVALEKVSSASP